MENKIANEKNYSIINELKLKNICNKLQKKNLLNQIDEINIKYNKIIENKNKTINKHKNDKIRSEEIFNVEKLKMQNIINNLRQGQIPTLLKFCRLCIQIFMSHSKEKYKKKDSIIYELKNNIK